MKTTAKLFFVLSMVTLIIRVDGQPWMQAPYFQLNGITDSSRLSNFYEIQKAFELYEKDQPNAEEDKEAPGNEMENEGKFPGYSQFKRWEAHMAPRVYPSGDISLPSTNWQKYQEYVKSSAAISRQSSTQSFAGSWVPMGPTGTHLNGYWGGAGRINFIRFDPANSNTIWAGSPSGGLWKSTNGGMNWSTNTDHLSVVGCSDVAIDPTNSNIIYLATGDANGMSTGLTVNSLGVLKSTDGGATWNTTGLTFTPNQLVSIYKLLINPVSPNIIFAASSSGLYRSANSGGSWTYIQSGSFTDVEFKPGHPNTVYATSGFTTSGKFYQSTNGGTSFTNITAGLPPTASVGRMEIGVTPADSDYVYVVAVNLTFGFYGFYGSTDGGTTFTLRANTPDILTGPAGAQAWYNLAIAVSPTNKNKVLVGGTNCWRTLDGGTTWVIHSDNTNSKAPFVHPDCHSLEFLPGNDSTYFSGNDGGIRKTSNNGATWIDMSNDLQIAQMYKMGTSASDPYRILTGHQDQGFHLLTSGNWSLFIGLTGDGMESIIDYTNDSIMYFGCNQGHLYKTANGGKNYSHPATIGGTGVNATGDWVTPVVMHPTSHTTLLIGKAQVYRTTDGGLSWSQVGTVSGGSGNITALAYAPSQPNYIYAARHNRFFAATDGNTFTDRTGTLPVTPAITAIAVSGNDSNKVWVTYSGYSAATKVYTSADGGLTWSNYSTGLPNLPVNCIVHQDGSPGVLYVGTDVGVYSRNDTSASWQPFSDGLPNIDVEELEINYAVNKLRAATNGRGLWESDLGSVPTGIAANATKNNISIIPNPNDGFFELKIQGEDLKNADITVTDALGRQVAVSGYSMQGPVCHLALPAISYGLYYVTVNSNGKQFRSKVIINK